MKKNRKHKKRAEQIDVQLVSKVMCFFFLVFGVVGSYCGFVAGLAGCGGGEHGR